MESVEAHKAGITLFAADCWSTAAHHCAWPTASSGWWPPPLLPLPLAILLPLLQPLRRLLRRDDSGRQASLAAVTAMDTLADICPHHSDGKRGGSQDAGSHRTRRCARAAAAAQHNAHTLRTPKHEGLEGCFVLFVGFTLPMQAEFPRFGGLRSEICRLAPCITVHHLANTA